MTYRNKTITKHQRGNWYVRVRHNGKVITIYGRTQLQAYDKLKLLVDRIEQETINEKFYKKVETLGAVDRHKAKIYTLAEWFDEWLNSYKVGNVRQATIDDFKKTFKLLEKLHNTDICDITNLMVSKAIHSILSGCRQKDKVHNLCKQMFTCALNDRIITSNPILSIPRPKQYAKYEKKAFTPEQEQKFIDLCLKDLDTYEPLLVCVLQGLRKGEMLALRPNDFDFKRNTLRIDESYDHNYPDDLKTKNSSSNRTMPMFELTQKLLLKYKDTEPTKRIYENYNGITLGIWLVKLLKKNGLPRLTLHELRHTFITRCHEKKIDEIVIQKWVGHAVGSRMTKAVYTHIMDTAEQNYIATMNTK